MLIGGYAGKSYMICLFLYLFNFNFPTVAKAEAALLTMLFPINTVKRKRIVMSGKRKRLFCPLITGRRKIFHFYPV
jgi:hypothetical protein